jgi:hypothetical protein
LRFGIYFQSQSQKPPPGAPITLTALQCVTANSW